jgi:hypothetical protein
VGVPECLLAKSVQNHDLVLDTSAPQIQLKFEPRILRGLSKAIGKFSQLND